MGKDVEAIDTIRAIAIFCVLVHHLHAYTGFSIPYLDLNGGLIGVQLFFLISGYLIIQSAIKYPLRIFFIHRFFRIFPPYLVALLVFSIGSYFFHDGYKQAFYVHWPYLLLNITNLQFLHPIPHLQLDTLHVGWSLTVELLWYIIAPILLIFIGKSNKSKTRWIVVLFLFFVVSIVWVFLAKNGFFNDFYRNSFSVVGVSPEIHIFRHTLIDNAPPAQFMYFIMGVLLYIFKNELLCVKSYFLSVLMISILLFIPDWNNIIGIYPNALTGVGCAALILWIQRFGIHDEFTKWLAKVSYSVYLIHVPILLIVFRYFSITGWLGLTIALGVIAIGSEIGWRLVEAPSQRLGKRLGLIV